MCIRDRTYREHKRIVFDGNNYSEEWVEEAARRGLSNLATAVDALPRFSTPKNIELFERHGVFSKAEVLSRQEILTQDYNNALNIEALTMLDMAKKQILPAVVKFSGVVADSYRSKKACNLELDLSSEESLLRKLSFLQNELTGAIARLDDSVIEAKGIADPLNAARCYNDKVFADMQFLRGIADELETIVSEEYWPFPTYSQLLFYV